MDAVLNLDKPHGITSQDAVTQVKRRLGAKKAGHAGTLDPIATGVLLVCIGEATKISRFLMDLEKEYLATLKFGERTDTQDADGRVVEEAHTSAFPRADVEEVVLRFVGEIRQAPPMYSAIKVSGKPLYRFARRGIKLSVPERIVTVRDISVEAYDFPYLSFRVVCSKGTYVRSLCDEIGMAMGSFAHMTALRRTRVGGFHVSGAATPDELPGKTLSFRSIDEALLHLSEARLSEEDYRFAANGRSVDCRSYGLCRDGDYVRLKDPGGRLFSIGLVAGGRIKIERIMHLQGKT